MRTVTFLQLYIDENLSIQEIADKLGISIGALAKRRKRLIKKGLLKPRRSPGPIPQDIRNYVLSRPLGLPHVWVAREVAKIFGRKIDPKSVFNIRATLKWH